MNKPVSPGLHPNNPHKGRYNIPALCKALPALQAKVKRNPKGEQTVDFTDSESVVLLNKALLIHHYGIEFWDIPKGFLCPPIPGRADYVHRLSEFIAKDEKKVRVLDVGTGASLIYPIIGATEYKWQFVTSDIDPISVKSSKAIASLNPKLKGRIDCRLQSSAKQIFKGIIKPGEHYHLTMCNPPFHKSLQEAEQGTLRKAKNLAANQRKRGNAPIPEKLKSGLNFGGQKAELWCPGGEETFVKNMADESKQFASQVGWFSTLISKKENVAKLKKRLKQLEASDIKVVDMGQGQKLSRFVAWRFTQ